VAPALPDAPELVSDLLAAGIEVLARCECAEMVRLAVRHAPAVVVVWEPYPGAEAQAPLFAALGLLQEVQPTPVLVFTSEVGAEAMELSIQAGVASWVVNGYSRDRVRPLIQYTLARGRHAARLRAELKELRVRYEERRLVDRAKGILMTARQVSEDEAFRLLRTASMQAKQRIGQVSQQVIDAAQYADAINQGGRLRMLSQRIVKLYALATAGVEVASSRALLASSSVQVREILDHLLKVVSRPSFGDLLDSALSAWVAMRADLDLPPSPAHTA
jgi:AmiR/NasT family two-component response regulator